MPGAVSASLPLWQTSTANPSDWSALRMNDAVFFSSSTTNRRMGAGKVLTHPNLLLRCKSVKIADRVVGQASGARPSQPQQPVTGIHRQDCTGGPLHSDALRLGQPRSGILLHYLVWCEISKTSPSCCNSLTHPTPLA